MAELLAEPLVDGLMRLDDGVLTLLGGRSSSSGLSHFPRQDRCPFTGADDVQPADLPRTGALLWWTAVTAAPPGYTGRVPYGLGVVELDGGLRVIGRLTEDDPAALAAGREMEVVADEVPGPDGEPRTMWAFAPVEPMTVGQ